VVVVKVYLPQGGLHLEYSGRSLKYWLDEALKMGSVRLVYNGLKYVFKGKRWRHCLDGTRAEFAREPGGARHSPAAGFLGYSRARACAREYPTGLVNYITKLRHQTWLKAEGWGGKDAVFAPGDGVEEMLFLPRGMGWRRCCFRPEGENSISLTLPVSGGNRPY